jgi:hypothetical protein
MLRSIGDKASSGYSGMVFTAWVDNPSDDLRNLVVLFIPEHDIEKTSR